MLIKKLADAFDIPMQAVQVSGYFSLRWYASSTVNTCRSRARRLIEGGLGGDGRTVTEMACCMCAHGGGNASLNSVYPQDIQAHRHGELAVSTTDTVEHDIAKVGEEIAVFNLCSDTTRHMNGVVTNMHPAEGVWLFRYAQTDR